MADNLQQMIHKRSESVTNQRPPENILQNHNQNLAMGG